ncbi:DNA repair protein RecN [Fulvivirgaceae bacterium LMO-SS25]
MLQQLSIRNYALIKELVMSPSAGLNMITGETGAGKSIMLGAVGLLLGERADSSVMLEEKEKCIIEGHFDIAAYQMEALFEREELDFINPCIIRREMSPGGRTRAFINDTPVKLETLKIIGSLLMDVHSQHQNLALGEKVFQLKIIDAFAGNKAILENYQTLYKEWKNAKDELDALEQKRINLQKDQDYNQFMFDELDAAKLNKDEQEETEAQLSVLENAEEIKLKIAEALALLKESDFPALDALRQSRSLLGQISSFGKGLTELYNRLESAFIELEDISQELETETEQVEFDPEKTAQLKERLDLIYRLQQKHQVATIGELIEIKEQYSAKLLDSEDTDYTFNKLKSHIAQVEQKLVKSGTELSKARKEVAPKLEKEIVSILQELGIPNGNFQIEMKPAEPKLSGADDIQFLFSANKGLKPGELKDVASGGEFSRLIFALKFIIAGKTALPTIVFDEIDTGVSGEIALKLAKMMRKMASKHQVITITHLPQMAVAGEKHFFVYKDNSEPRTVSRIRELSPNDRLLEIAKMIGGENPSATTIQNAKELLETVN